MTGLPPHERTSLFFFATIQPPFILDDVKILEQHFALDLRVLSGIRALPALIAGIVRSDLVLVWFGSVYAGIAVFLAHLFGKKSAVIVAGVDASKDPEINYGIWLSPWKSLFVRYAYRHADRVLPVAPFLANEVKRLADYAAANVVTIPFGFDTTFWKPSVEKEAFVLTVASCENESRFKKKGLDKLFAAARALPDVRFRVIGIHREFVSSIAARIPPNVEIVTHVERRQLLEEYQRAKVYCQPSFTEGLPNTLCEAMACGCIPVGTIAGGIPTAIGDTGFLVDYRDQTALENALRTALTLPASSGLKARDRIMNDFTIRGREQALVNELQSLLR